MDRIVIIGNGFDLAHGLKTGYSDFFDYLKQDIVDNGESKTPLRAKGDKINIIDSSIKNRILDNGVKCKWLAVKETNQEFDLIAADRSNSLYFRELFTEYKENGYWSDLESCYFNVLNKHKDTKKYVNIINEEFEYLKSLLEDYLKIEVEGKIDDKVNVDNSIYQMIQKNSRLSSEFEKNYFVTFNYISKYLNLYLYFLQTYYSHATKNRFDVEPIHIHGVLKNKNNPIILGYGDENSDEYKKIELSGNNELLKNFKTFQYLRTSKYTQVLGLLESSKDIYVQVIGHSCGLCDKALLRTIFQHDNVKHIEAVYYDSSEKYFENLYNISRIFDDNTLMRERMVSLDKTFKI